MSEKEKSVLATLIEREDLAEKKTRIYARLLTDSAVVKTLQEVADSHRKNGETLACFLGLKPQKDGGMVENKGETGDA